MYHNYVLLFHTNVLKNFNFLNIENGIDIRIKNKIRIGIGIGKVIGKKIDVNASWNCNSVLISDVN